MSSDLNNHTVLLTGAGGFLGSVIHHHFVKRGACVICLTADPEKGSQKGWVTIDLTNEAELIDLHQAGDFTAVIHCAAKLPRHGSDIDILLDNQKMTYLISKWAVAKKISHFLFASGCSIYGYGDQPRRETDLPMPTNLYVSSKLASENVVLNVTDKTETTPCILRISAPYGPNQNTDTVIKHFISQAKENQLLKIYGSGKRSQDFIYQEDVATAFGLALIYHANGIFNVSGDNSVSMFDLANIVRKIFLPEKEVQIEHVANDPQESYRGIFPIDKARDQFSYQPSYSLEKGLRLTAKAWSLL